MKIKTEEAVYNIPINNGICNIASTYLNDFVDCLTSYFINRKKNKCIIIDDEGDLIKNDDIEFIYIPYGEDLSQVFEFKPKTLLNNELSSYIDNNQEKYTSIDRIRNLAYEFLTDAGMFDLIKIMKMNTSIDIKLKINDFDVSRLLQMLSIESENISIQDKYIILYNMLLYKNKNKYSIIYMDFPIDDSTLLWISKSMDSNKLVLLKNESIISSNKEFIKYMLILSNNEFVESIEEKTELINNLTYCFHPYVLENIDQQNEKNIEIINKFSDKESTFLIKFTNQYTF